MNEKKIIMTTISIQVKDAAFAASIINKYRRHRKIAGISVFDSETNNPHGFHAIPGSPMDVVSFVKKIRKAEKSKGVSWEKVKAELF